MAVSVDLINSTLDDLRGPAELAFVENLPTWEKMLVKNGTTGHGGTYIKRVHIGSAPSRARGLFTGMEVLPVGTANITQSLTVEPHEGSASVVIPRKELERNEGKEAAVRLIDEYPRAQLAAMAQDFDHYLLDAHTDALGFLATPELYGWVTLNGEFAAGLNVGTTTGLLDFLTRAAQNVAAKTCQNVVKSTAYNYVNQYEVATSWAADTWRQIVSCYASCAQYGGPPDMILVDPTTYAYYMESRRDITRLTAITGEEGKTDFLASSLGKAQVHNCINLVPANFAGTGANGVTYILNTKFWEACWYGGKKGPRIGKFQESVHDQRVIWAPVDIHVGLICKNLPAQGCVGGTALP